MGVGAVVAPARALASEPLAREEQAIYGGRAASECEWPAVAALGEACSATLVHPSLLLYAAHCGTSFESATFGETVASPRRRVSLARCEAHPDYEFGNDADVAYCLLEERLDDAPIVPLAAGCEVERLVTGLPVTIVGFGFDGDFTGFGTKRFAPSSVSGVGAMLELESETTNTCLGDSGGPVFASLRALGVAPDDALRLIAVTSAGPTLHCVPDWGLYTSVHRFIPWLEPSAGLDLTPCFDEDGRWAPSAACVDSPSASSVCTRAADPGYRYAASCGAPFAEGPPPLVPPLTRSAHEPEAGTAVAESCAFRVPSPVRRSWSFTPWIVAMAVLCGRPSARRRSASNASARCRSTTPDLAHD